MIPLTPYFFKYERQIYPKALESPIAKSLGRLYDYNRYVTVSKKE